MAQYFDFCKAMTLLCRDVCARHPEFRHIRMEEVAVTFSQARSPVEWGVQARLTPLRFEKGARVQKRNGRLWTVQRVIHEGRECLYLLTFLLPRFLNLSFDEKLVTVFHELYHISPSFDGDIRRFNGTCYVHTGSQKNYDRHMAIFAEQYLKRGVPEELLYFLRWDFAELRRRKGDVVGLRIALPRLIQLDKVA